MVPNYAVIHAFFYNNFEPLLFSCTNMVLHNQTLLTLEQYEKVSWL